MGLGQKLSGPVVAAAVGGDTATIVASYADLPGSPSDGDRILIIDTTRDISLAVEYVEDFGNSVGGWKPAGSSATVGYVVDAALIEGVADGGAVASLPLSTMAAATAGAGEQALYRATGGPGGTVPAVEFDGSNDHYDLPAAGRDIDRNKADIAVVWVGEWNALSGNRYVHGSSTGDAASENRIIFGHETVSGRVGARRLDTDGGATTTGGTFTTGSYDIAAWRWNMGTAGAAIWTREDDGDMDVLVPQVTPTFGSAGNTSDTASVNVCIGSNGDGNTGTCVSAKVAYQVHLSVASGTIPQAEIEAWITLCRLRFGL